jgi:hypothetical protein
VSTQIGGRLLRFFSSLGLSCVLLVLLGLLTWLGTLEQVHSGLYEVQRKYFESFVLMHDAGPFSVPLPGANLVLSLLAVNLVLGGLVRIRKSSNTAGILVVHVGILLLLGAAFVKHHASQDGRVTLYEGQSSTWFESDMRWEIAIREHLGDGTAREHVVAQESFQDAAQGAPVRIAAPDLPFTIEVLESMPNSRPQKGDGGVQLRAVPREPEAARNIAGARVTLVDARGQRTEGLLWGAQDGPFTTTTVGRRFELELRRERYPLPFALKLADFRKEDHPRSNMPKSFESDVAVRSAGSERALTISMNEPLRAEGLVVYQASWGPQNAGAGVPLYSTFAVVRNPADSLPLIACIVIGAGLFWHFGRKLARHVRIERGGA